MQAIDRVSRALGGLYEKLYESPTSTAGAAQSGSEAFTAVISTIVTDLLVRGPGFVAIVLDGTESAVLATIELHFAMKPGGTYCQIPSAPLAELTLPTPGSAKSMYFMALPAVRPPYLKIRAYTDGTDATGNFSVWAISA